MQGKKYCNVSFPISCRPTSKSVCGKMTQWEWLIKITFIPPPLTNVSTCWLISMLSNTNQSQLELWLQGSWVTFTINPGSSENCASTCGPTNKTLRCDSYREVNCLKSSPLMGTYLCIIGGKYPHWYSGTNCTAHTQQINREIKKRRAKKEAAREMQRDTESKGKRADVAFGLKLLNHHVSSDYFITSGTWSTFSGATHTQRLSW